jgi:hypothetical protein
MAYKITSDRLDCDKAMGDSITTEELLEMGANIDALVSAGHISDATPSANAPASEGATK